MTVIHYNHNEVHTRDEAGAEAERERYTQVLVTKGASMK